MTEIDWEEPTQEPELCDDAHCERVIEFDSKMDEIGHWHICGDRDSELWVCQGDDPGAVVHDAHQFYDQGTAQHFAEPFDGVW